MQRHIKRVGGGLVAAIVFGSVLLMTDIPKALEQADRSFAFLGSSLGISNPPPHFVSDAWHHPWVVLLAFFFVFAVGVLLSWGIEAAWVGLWGKSPRGLATAPPPIQMGQSSSVATLGIKVTRAPAFDVSLTEAALYAVTGKWGMIAGKEHFPTNQERVATGNKVADWLADFEQKASDGSVRVWGKPRGQTDCPLVEIDALHWRDHEAYPLSVATGEPTTRIRGIPANTDGFEDLRVNKAEFEREWPHA